MKLAATPDLDSGSLRSASSSLAIPTIFWSLYKTRLKIFLTQSTIIDIVPVLSFKLLNAAFFICGDRVYV